VTEENESKTENGITITLTEAQTRLFVSLCTMLLSPRAIKQPVTEWKLGIGASDNLIRSLRRRFEKALKKDDGPPLD
jgi:hypothetical protein